MRSRVSDTSHQCAQFLSSKAIAAPTWPQDINVTGLTVIEAKTEAESSGYLTSECSRREDVTHWSQVGVADSDIEEVGLTRLKVTQRHRVFAGDGVMRFLQLVVLTAELKVKPTRRIVDRVVLWTQQTRLYMYYMYVSHACG